MLELSLRAWLGVLCARIGEKEEEEEDEGLCQHGEAHRLEREMTANGPCSVTPPSKHLLTRHPVRARTPSVEHGFAPSNRLEGAGHCPFVGFRELWHQSIPMREFSFVGSPTICNFLSFAALLRDEFWRDFGFSYL